MSHPQIETHSPEDLESSAPDHAELDAPSLSAEGSSSAEGSFPVEDSSSGDGSFSAEGSSPAKGSSADDTPRRGLPIWLFVVLFVAAVVALGWQFRIAGELEQEIAGLEADLAETSALLDAHQMRLTEIRGGVRDLAAQVAGLQALVDAEPSGSASGGSPNASDTSVTSVTSGGSSSQAASRPATRREIPARLPR